MASISLTIEPATRSFCPADMAGPIICEMLFFGSIFVFDFYKIKKPVENFQNEKFWAVTKVIVGEVFGKWFVQLHG